MKKYTRITLLLLYICIVLVVYLIFQDDMQVDMHTAVVYAGIVALAVIAMDQLFHRMRSALLFSSIAFAILFLLLGDLIVNSLDEFFQNMALRIGLLMFCFYAGLVVGAQNAWVFRFLEQISLSVQSDHIIARIKVLDTSVLIDGRIGEMVNSGLMEGRIIIPSFVLGELQHIADSHNHTIRQKGKRGLETLQKLQDQKICPTEIRQMKEDKNTPVDMQLVNLALAMDGTLVTTDHNLEMVAKIQKLSTINLNDLSISMRQKLLPGEEIVVQLTKDGKEPGQGLAYLDDGTMVVVDAGKKHIGETVNVEITSLIQTDTGRIIFAVIKQ
jgi:uncharacterized protein YacL